MKGSTLLIIGGAVAAYLYLSKQGQGDGGQGGSLNIPTLSDIIGSSSPTSAPATDPAVTTMQQPSILDVFTPKGASGMPLTSEKKAVSSGSSGYGNSGVYVTQPSRNPTGNTGGIGLLPFGSSMDYQAPYNQQMSAAGTIQPLLHTSSYMNTKKSVSSSQNYTSQGGGNYTNIPTPTRSGTVHTYSKGRWN